MSRRPDIGRMASSVSRPGIDPRVWLTLAHVTEVGFDPKHGLFADLVFQPGGEQETAYYGSPYAGGGFGDHCPLEVDDTVLVALPMGEPGHGPIIVARFNNSGDPPHADFGAGAVPSSNRVIRVRPGQQLILRTTDGNVVIEGEGSANLNLRAAGSGDALLEAAGGSIDVKASSDLSAEAQTGSVSVSAQAGDMTLEAMIGQLVAKALTIQLQSTAAMTLSAGAALALSGAGVTIGGVPAAGGGGPPGAASIGIKDGGTALGGDLAIFKIAIAELVQAEFVKLQTVLVAAFTAVGIGVSANGPAGAAVVSGYAVGELGSSTAKVSP